MNYTDSNLRSALASEYVLGTLTGGARLRFERLIAQSPEIMAHVISWERRLAALDDAAPAIEPPARVWRNIQLRIGAGRRWSHPQLRFWRGLGLAASAVSVVLGIFLLMPWINPPTESYISIVRNTQHQPLWLVRIDPDQRSLSLTTLNTAQVEAGKSLELWLLPEDRPPVSLGVLPSQGKLTAVLAGGGLVRNAKGLAVSVEPSGGSPTGQPTGPVVFQAQLFPLG